MIPKVFNTLITSYLILGGEIMSIHLGRKKQKLNPILGVLILTFSFGAPISIQAQAVLEEIIVTAQRREQSLLDVPISIETISGDELQEQGFRNMDDLANFTTSVLVNPDHLRNSITVRGFGASTADALTIEQSAPTFLDGVHFGRTNMIKFAFLDVERIEVLKGPQPVYFGQNAVSGAFNISSVKPSSTWEGDLDTDIGNFGRHKVDIGVGGPITETLGIRIAGRFEDQDGYLVDAISRNPYPKYKNFGGRIILQWKPTENFQATTKFEQTDLDQGSSNRVTCRIPGLIGARRGVPVFDESLWANPPQGAGWDGPDYIDFGSDCFNSNVGRDSQGPWFPPPANIIQNRRSYQVDNRVVADALFQQEHGINATQGIEKLQPWTSYLDMQYELGSGIVLSSLTSFSKYKRISNRENRYTPLLNNIQFRDETFGSLSQEIRATSPGGGYDMAEMNVEWMIGLYYQDTDQVGIQDMLRNNTRRSRRFNRFDEQAKWHSAFGTVTLNMMDEKLSLDLGARVTNYSKTTAQKGWGGRWILDDGSPDGLLLPWGTRADLANVNDPENGLTAIGWTALIPNTNLGDSAMGGPYDDIVNPKSRDKGTEFDPQITLRYRPTDNHSMYAKFAQSFKAGGADTGIAFVSTDPEEFEFEPEYATTYEIGSKGKFMDGRGRYTLSAFYSKIIDLQIAAATPDPISAALEFGNAGKQSASGVELSIDAAVSDEWTLGLGAAYLDSVLDEFESPCTEEELDNADTNDCISAAESAASGGTIAAGRIDRSGSRSPNAPEWKFVLTSNYELPILDNYLLRFNAKGFYSDGYLTDTTGFSRTISYDAHADVNIQVGFGDANDTWNVAIYGRNLLEHRPTYHAQFDLTPEGLAGTSLYSDSFTQYGVKFEYNYR
ncbi:MAG: iron complex outermembrane receptor protein [Gammaproteobacteria bacterium]